MYRKARSLFWGIVILCLLFGAGQLLLPAAGHNRSGRVVITEFVASNGTGLADKDGDYSDWIELHNPTGQAINLAGWALSDDPTRPAKWTFPGRTLASGGYLLVFASGKDRKAGTPENELHTNFRLNAAGEVPLLYNLLDESFSQPFPAPLPQFRDVAYGLIEAETFGYLAQPTPGQPNDSSQVWAGVVAPVTFSVERGFYEQPVPLALQTVTPGAVIRYTLDGSEPGESHGEIYTQPLAISGTRLVRAAAFKPGWLPSPVNTHTYLFLNEVLTQPPDPPGFFTTWGIHAQDYEADRAGEPVSADYEMDPEVVHDPHYRDRIKEALQAIPTLSIVTDRQSFDIYANPRQKGPGWERAASVELIDPTRSQPGFQINAGVRIQGAQGRYEYVRKHSFRLFFKSKYGSAKLTYPLFPDSPVEMFDTLILRGGVSSSYAGVGLIDYRQVTYTRDQWLRSTQIAASGVGSHGIFVHLYLNGLYWGLYNVVERPDESFLSAYLGGGKEEWYATNQGGPIWGDGRRFDTLYRLVQEGNLADPARYDQLKSYLDIPHFIDYTLINWYAGNQDWPDTNWYAGVHNPDGPVKFFIWDAEYTWLHGAEVRFGYRDNHFEPLMQALLENPDFRMEFADRAYKHLFNGGILADAQAQARWLALNRPIELAIIGESARWGDARVEPAVTQADWRKAHEAVLAQMEGNAARLIHLLREEGYYPEIDPPQFKQPGGLVEPGFSLTVNSAQAGEATLYYTLDGSDPRVAVIGAVAPTAQAYHEPLLLTSTTRIKARLLQGDSWSALQEAVFYVALPDRQLQLTELMYNPAGGNGYEFIELKNWGDGPVELAGATFEGINFTFPAGIPPLAPGGGLVLASDPAAFAARYPAVSLAGVYSGRLSDAGETIALRDSQGNLMFSVTYDDENGWPVSPDGRGDSLVLVDPGGDANDPQNWRASLSLNGSPGEDEPGLEPGGDQRP